MVNPGDREKLVKMIKKAIEDHEITEAEYIEIIDLADKDGIIDKYEKGLLQELHSLISNKTVKRVP